MSNGFPLVGHASLRTFYSEAGQSVLMWLGAARGARPDYGHS